MREGVMGYGLMLFYGLGLLACGGKASQPGDAGFLPSGEGVDFGAECGVDLAPCPTDRMCATLDLASGQTRPKCVLMNVCDQLGCPGRCDIAESFPARVGCDGHGAGSGD
jgi:hypothetical protein